jgi:hypothetical protein
MSKITKLVIPTTAPSPARSTKWNKGLTLQSADLLEPMSAASNDTTRYVLNGICFDQDSIIGTDGRRLLRIVHDVTPLMHGKEPTILPNDKQTVRFIKDAPMLRIQLSTDGQWFKLTAFGREHCVKKVAGQYPNWRQVLPDSKNRWHLTFDSEQVAKVLRDLPVDKKEPAATIEFRDGYSKATVGKTSVLFHCVGNAAATIRLNAIMLAQAVKQGFATAYLNMDKLEEPVLFTKANAAYVQMPMVMKAS